MICRKKLLIIFVCVVVIFDVCGCNKTVKKQTSNETSKIIVTEEEQIWDDSSVDEIYNQRLFLYDQYSEFKDDKDYDFKKDIEFLNTIKDKNKFANNFLELLNDTNIVDIVENGTKIEQYVLYSYLSVKIKRCEGLCAHNNTIKYITIDLDDYAIGKIYYRDRSFTSDLKPIMKDAKSSWPCFIIEFYSTKEEGQYIYIITNPSDSLEEADSFYVISDSNRTLDSAKAYAHKMWVEIYNESTKNEHEFNWIELSPEIVNNVINHNKNFLDFYINYKKNIFFSRYDVENPPVKYSDGDSKFEPSIGMTAEQVEASTWGSPKKKNKDTYSWGTREQWVYSKGYIYFRNGIVSSISER